MDFDPIIAETFLEKREKIQGVQKMYGQEQEMGKEK